MQSLIFDSSSHWVEQASLVQCRSQARINGEGFQDSPSKTLEENLFAQATHGWPNMVSRLIENYLLRRMVRKLKKRKPAACEKYQISR
ncbi:hypothetical protein SK128_011939 [Halocaridina rubra]|uniref:Uncharacterized protein n=1 Tax=Halocaridina rubra TaxID=373956 RepID=A0AAN9FTW5_HALRR